MWEHLTDDIEKQAQGYLAQVKEMGGALTALEAGFPQFAIQEAAFRSQQEQESGRRIIVGVNAFTDGEDEFDERHLLEVDEKVQSEQAQRVQQLKQSRDSISAEQCLDRIEEAAKDSTVNLMPHVVDAVSNLATTGEICNRLRRVWGEHQADTFI